MDNYNAGKIIQLIMSSELNSDKRIAMVEDFLKLLNEKQTVKVVTKDVSLPCPYQHYPNYNDNTGTAKPITTGNPIWIVDLQQPLWS